MSFIQTDMDTSTALPLLCVCVHRVMSGSDVTLELRTGVLVSFPCSYAQLSDNDFESIMKGEAEIKDFVTEEEKEDKKK